MFKKKNAMPQDIQRDPAAPNDEQWAEMLRDCRQRSKEWTEDDMKAFGDGRLSYSMTPHAVAVAVVVAFVFGVLYYGARLIHVI